MQKILRLAVTLVLLTVMIPYRAEGLMANKVGTKPMKMNVQIGAASFTATLEDNQTVSELVEMMRQGSVTVEMDDYSGFEKVGSLGTRLAASDAQTTTAPGDIVLYSASNIVMFYGSNTWAYTRIGHIDNLSGWEEALGDGSITAVFTLAEAQV